MNAKQIIKTAEAFLAGEAESPGHLAAVQVAVLLDIARSLSELTALAKKAAAEEGGEA